MTHDLGVDTARIGRAEGYVCKTCGRFRFA